MKKNNRLRRSLAWATVTNMQQLEELLEGPADCIVLDLEDGIPVPLKPFAREKTREAVAELDFRGKERIVRVNPVDTAFFSLDMEEVISQAPPDAIRLPKCESVSDMLMVDSMLSEIERAHGLPPSSIEVLAMIETPIGVRNAYDIAVCCGRVTAISIGMEDMCREYGVRRRYENNALDMLYLRQKLILDSKAAGTQIHDSVLLNYGDLESTMREAVESKQMGFTGRSVHGNEQAAFVNRVFSPDPDELEESREIVQVYEEAVAKGLSDTITCRGKFICYAAYEHAKDLVKLAAEIAAKEAGTL